MLEFDNPLPFLSIWKTLKPCIGNCRIIAQSPRHSVLEKVGLCQSQPLRRVSDLPKNPLLQKTRLHRAIEVFAMPGLDRSRHSSFLRSGFGYATLGAGGRYQRTEMASPQVCCCLLNRPPNSLSIAFPNLTEPWMAHKCKKYHLR